MGAQVEGAEADEKGKLPERSYIEYGPGDVVGEGGLDVGAGVLGAGAVGGGVEEFGDVGRALRLGGGEFDVEGGAGGVGGEDLGQGVAAGGEVGEVDVVEGAGGDGAGGDLVEEMGGPGGDAGPVDGEIADEVVGEGDGGNAVVGGFAGGGDGAGDDEVLAHVAAVVDAGEDEVGLEVEAEEGDADAVGGGAVDGVAVGSAGFGDEGLVGGDAVATLGLLGGGGDDDDAGGGEGEGGVLEGLKALGVDAVVVGEEDDHGKWLFCEDAIILKNVVYLMKG
jgi:hypothetical protein